MVATFIGKLTSGIWKYVLLIGAGLLFIAKIFTMGRNYQRTEQQEEDLEHVRNRNEALEDVNSLPDDAVDRELREYISKRNKP